MFVWTEKAEEAYRARHPHRKNERKAGTLVTWEGQELQSGTILQGYASLDEVASAQDAQSAADEDDSDFSDEDFDAESNDFEEEYSYDDDAADEDGFDGDEE